MTSPRQLGRASAVDVPAWEVTRPAGMRAGPGVVAGQWVPPGRPVRVGAWIVPGAVYVGTSKLRERPVAPLLDLNLPVDSRAPDWRGASMPYWPSYSGISPAARAAYLMWSAAGRNATQAYIGYVFLYFYGLERRVLNDLLADLEQGGLRAASELAWIRGEVCRLRDIYGGSSSFWFHASAFLSVLDLLLIRCGTFPAQPPSPRKGIDPIPVTLTAALGLYAVAGRAIPPRWALAWATFHREIPFRTPALRCPKEFEILFTHRYAARCGEGIRPVQGGRTIAVDYRAADRDLGRRHVRLPGVPYVFDQAAACLALEQVVEEATAGLDAYSRYLGRNPDMAGTLRAAALLPDGLLDPAAMPLEGLAETARGLLGDRTQVLLTRQAVDSLVSGWPRGAGGRLSTTDAAALARLLRRAGFAVEPDTGFGGIPLGGGPAVLFAVASRTAAGPDVRADARYAAALAVLRLAAAVGGTGGHLAAGEAGALAGQVGAELELTPAQGERLRAHALWLTATGTKLTGIGQQLETLNPRQRQVAAELVVTAATAAGAVTAAQARIAEKIYAMLGLDPAAAYSRRHAASGTEPGTATPAPGPGPVTVRPAGPAGPSYRIPPDRIPPDRIPPDRIPPDRIPPECAGEPPMPGRRAGARPALLLNRAEIAAKMAETAEVAALLDTVFAGDDDPAAAAVSPGHLVSASGTPTFGAARSRAEPDGAGRDDLPAGSLPDQDDAGPGPPIAGLDAAHGLLLRALAARQVWTAADLAGVCAGLGLLPAGALDVINEAAIEACGEPFTDSLGDGTAINDYAVQEIFG